MVAPGIRMIDCSSNELQMLVLKACRGVDLPFSQAQEVASAIAASPRAIPNFLEYYQSGRGITFSTFYHIYINIQHTLDKVFFASS